MGSRIREDLVPVTVVAGYLGAGKTTLINELLAHEHGRRLAVLVNDFGAVNIDEALIAEHRGQTISLRNGCICCSIADELGDALDRVLALEPPPDQVVVEASGVADPANVAAYGQGWPGCRLDAVIVLADAETVRAKSRDQFVGELVTRQLHRADIVMVTKCDLVTETELATVMGWIAENVPGAPILAWRAGGPDPALLLAAGRASGASEATPPQRSNTSTDHLEAAFNTVVVEVNGALERDRGRSRASGLARLHPAGEGLPPTQRPPRQAPRHPPGRAALEHRGSPQRPRLNAARPARGDRPARNSQSPRPHRVPVGQPQRELQEVAVAVEGADHDVAISPAER